MSHPPEKSLSSRELAERIWVCGDDHSLTDDYPERWKEKAAALIEAWVRVREAEAQRNEAWQWHEKRCPHKITQGCECWSCVRLSKWESALVKARKQLEETR